MLLLLLLRRPTQPQTVRPRGRRGEACPSRRRAPAEPNERCEVQGVSSAAAQEPSSRAPSRCKPAQARGSPCASCSGIRQRSTATAALAPPRLGGRAISAAAASSRGWRGCSRKTAPAAFCNSQGRCKWVVDHPTTAPYCRPFLAAADSRSHGCRLCGSRRLVVCDECVDVHVASGVCLRPAGIARTARVAASAGTAAEVVGILLDWARLLGRGWTGHGCSGS